MGGNDGVLNETFLSDILADPAYPAALYFDAANVHIYGPQSEAIRRMSYVQSTLSAFGAGGRPIWVTEVGYSSDLSLQRVPTYQGDDAQARYLRDMVPFVLQIGAAKVFWAHLNDEPDGTGNYRSHGLLDSLLVAKPSYGAYRDVIAATPPPAPVAAESEASNPSDSGPIQAP
jgi:hypothetical protein